MRYLWFISALASLPACAPLPKTLFTPTGADRAWEISGKHKQHTNILRITINGETVIEDTLDHRRGKNTLIGSYDNRMISVTCKSVESYMSQQERCTVMVDDEQAAELTL